MKHPFFKYITLLLIICNNHFSFSQKNKVITPTKYPTSFTIELKELDQIFTHKTKSVYASKTNVYLNKSLIVLNSSYKENKQLKLKLNYFKNAELYVQINGKDSKIIYILSSDDSVFYNSKTEGDKIIMTQCRKDDIISE